MVKKFNLSNDTTIYLDVEFKFIDDFIYWTPNELYWYILGFIHYLPNIWPIPMGLNPIVLNDDVDIEIIGRMK